LRADLTAPTYTVVPMGNWSGIRIELKDDIRDRIGRSPGRGDAVVMCLSEGNNAMRRATWHRDHAQLQTTAVRGYAHMKARSAGPTASSCSTRRRGHAADAALPTLRLLTRKKERIDVRTLR
jgi:hypothetical protein